MNKHWIIGLCVAALYVGVSVLFHGWAWTWVIWVAYAAYRWWKR